MPQINRTFDHEDMSEGRTASTPRPWIKRTALWIAGCAILFGLIWMFIPSPNTTAEPRVTIIDSRLHVFSAKVAEDSTTIYFGNQLEGQARDKLRQLGAPVETLSRGVYGKPGGRTFFVKYDFPLPNDPGAHLDAELVDEHGTVFPLRCGAGGQDGSPRKYWNLWTLESLPPNSENCVLRLKLQTEETPVGEITFDKL
ncbi:MAG: hypothetical protein K9N55_19755 [Phycisphaerae bacterium]|nr:hypothetical protein [Phycisphaerae bacterium]